MRRAAAALLQGIEVGSLFEQQKVFDVLVVGTPSSRRSLTSIRNLPIDTPRGQAPLGELAAVRVRPAPTVIEREAVSRYVDVRAQLGGGDRGRTAAEIGRRLGQIPMPLGYHAELRGSSGTGREASARLAGVALAAALAIYLVLQAALGSWRLAAVAFLTLPVALAGSPLALAALERVLSLGALVGLLAFARMVHLVRTAPVQDSESGQGRRPRESGRGVTVWPRRRAARASGGSAVAMVSPWSSEARRTQSASESSAVRRR